jgi:hypothetical protein
MISLATKGPIGIERFQKMSLQGSSTIRGKASVGTYRRADANDFSGVC